MLDDYANEWNVFHGLTLPKTTSSYKLKSVQWKPSFHQMFDKMLEWAKMLFM